MGRISLGVAQRRTGEISPRTTWAMREGFYGGNPAKRETKYRVQLDFSEEAFQELNALQKTLRASSRSEVVRKA